MQIKDYQEFKDYKKISLTGIYEGVLINNLDYNLENIIKVEAPITLNTLKQRLREELDVKKISQNMLDIINDRLNHLEIIKTDNFYDITLWPKTGKFVLDYVRRSNRQIYDIPFEELNVLCVNLISQGFDNEQIKREMLKFFGYEVLTKKANDYLDFVIKKSQ